jgi:hypothetical protein
MRSSLVAMVLSGTLGCAQVLGIDDFDDRVATGGGYGGRGGDPGGGGSGAVAGSGGAAPGGGGTGGADCVHDYVSVVEADSPASFIRFEEQDGTTVHDHLGVPGTVGFGVELDVPALLACADGSAASFPGQPGGNVNFGSVLGFEGYSSFSLEVWLSAGALEGMVIRKLSPSPADGYTLAFANGSLYFRRYQNGGADSLSVDSSILGTVAVHHVVGTYDGSAQRMCLYVDGKEIECQLSNTSIGSSGGDFLIGTSSFVGIIDEVAVYAAPLSLERVGLHYEAGSGTPPE